MTRADESGSLLLSGVARITIDWLRGGRADLPLYAGAPDAETLTMLGGLIAINEAGTPTTGSQPAQVSSITQREYVEGLCTRAAAAGLEEVNSPSMWVLTAGPSAEGDSSLPLSWSDDRETAWASCISEAELEPLTATVSELEFAQFGLWRWVAVGLDPDRSVLHDIVTWAQTEQRNAL